MMMTSFLTLRHKFGIFNNHDPVSGFGVIILHPPTVSARYLLTKLCPPSTKRKHTQPNSKTMVRYDGGNMERTEYYSRLLFTKYEACVAVASLILGLILGLCLNSFVGVSLVRRK